MSFSELSQWFDSNVSATGAIFVVLALLLLWVAVKKIVTWTFGALKSLVSLFPTQLVGIAGLLIGGLGIVGYGIGELTSGPNSDTLSWERFKRLTEKIEGDQGVKMMLEHVKAERAEELARNHPASDNTRGWACVGLGIGMVVLAIGSACKIYG